MAGLIQSDGASPSYRGLPSIFEFINGDGRWNKFNCGQAAACTYLTHLGRLHATEATASDVMQAVERAHPPDNLGGWLGTSRRRVERICRAHGIETDAIQGEAELRLSLINHRPVIVMLGMNWRRFLEFTVPSGHWMVAYGFDAEYIYLSNWGHMTWNQFRRGWRGFVPWLIRMQGIGLTASHSP